MNEQTNIIYMIRDDNENENEYKRVFEYDVTNDDLNASGVFYGTLYDNLYLLNKMYVINKTMYTRVNAFVQTLQLIDDEICNHDYYNELRALQIEGLQNLTTHYLNDCKNRNTKLIK